jgi:hypothetical protein
VDTLRERHNRRLRLLDPLLPDSPPLPEAGPEDVRLEVPGGIGLARLVRADPSTLDGFSATLLHYVGVNPLAGPFWHRCGYRPLSTNWEVRPAAHLR